MRLSGIFPALVLAGAAACGSKAGQANQDADRPAVVKAPPVVLRSDTAHPDTMEAHREKEDQLKRQLSEAHSFIAAMAVIGDLRTMARFYLPDAQVTFADSTFVGPSMIVAGLSNFVHAQSVKEMARAPRSLVFSDSVVLDSGAYGILSQRAGGERRELRGQYVTVWHRQPGSTTEPWVVFRDHVMPGTTTAGSAKKSAPATKKAQ